MTDYPVFSDISDSDQEWVRKMYKDIPGASKQDFPVLYQYKRANCDTLRQIEKKRIHLSNPTKFNDPYDCWLASHILIKKLLDIEKDKKIKTPIDEFEESSSVIQAKIQKNLRVSCLSKEKNNFRMWSYYTNHEGVCIAYKTRNLFDNPVEYNGIPFRPFPVVYTDDLKQLINFIDKNYQGMLIDAQILRLILFLKCKLWEYEKEWRFVRYAKDTDDNKEYYVPIPILTVYCGVKISDKYKNQVLEAAEEAGCTVVQMALSREAIGLVEGETLYKGK